jgi:hypothetical protein
LRNARQGDRRRKRAAASLGKYHPCITHPKPYIESADDADYNAVAFLHGIDGTLSFIFAGICFSRPHSSGDRNS